MTTDPTPAWEDDLARLWSRLDDLDAADFVQRITDHAAQLPVGHPVGLFERGAACDSTGRPDLAVPLYEQALAAGLDGLRRRRAVIQMASSLRNLGDIPRAASLLEAERSRPDDELTQAVDAFLALAWADLGCEREALSLALKAVAHYLPRYNRSLARYAAALVDPEDSA